MAHFVRDDEADQLTFQIVWQGEGLSPRVAREAGTQYQSRTSFWTL